MNEFDLIRQFFEQAEPQRDDVSLGIGDDCALLTPKPNHAIAVTTDTMVDGVHFDNRLSPADLAHKLVAVNLSDLASMGAEPCWVSLALTLPESNQAWLSEFAEALADQLSHYQVALIGGDTTKGPLTLTLTAQGQVASGKAMTRSGAQVGDLILVSGSLGDAALALQQQKILELTPAEQQQIEQRLFRPTPRVALGLELANLASSCIDLSDGLAADLGHILNRSGTKLGSSLGARLATDKLPVSTIAEKLLGAEIAAQNALSGGDDYELCFTLAPQHLTAAQAIAEQTQTPVTVIGEIIAGNGLNLFYQGAAVNWQVQGYLHFTDEKSND